ncbi:MAG: Redox-sensing transcriptional repressor Rex [Firmicutes bacterium ADurb.Bin182]|nr:MAG: Redox-sensing transcriptional repressor Rex [Firmicutes bacterium ADurb.Bin182]
MKQGKISEAVIRRLPRYYRHLITLNEQGVERISSGELANIMNLNASQIRQDFNNFDSFGQQGYGYQVKNLIKELGKILALNKTYKMIIIGAGNIGRALTFYDGFRNSGFEVCALFDNDPSLVGCMYRDVPVYHVDLLEEYIAKNNITIGIYAAHSSFAQDLSEKMIKAGVKAIWNFAPVDINSSVPVENVHLVDSLYVLSYKLNNQSGA